MIPKNTQSLQTTKQNYRRKEGIITYIITFLLKLKIPVKTQKVKSYTQGNSLTCCHQIKPNASEMLLWRLEMAILKTKRQLLWPIIVFNTRISTQIQPVLGEKSFHKWSIKLTAPIICMAWGTSTVQASVLTLPQ